VSTNLSSAGSTGAKASPTPANTGCRGEWGFDRKIVYLHVMQEYYGRKENNSIQGRA